MVACMHICYIAHSHCLHAEQICMGLGKFVWGLVVLKQQGPIQKGAFKGLPLTCKSYQGIPHTHNM